MTAEPASTDAEADALSRAKVFISYSRKDIGFADRLEQALKARGFDPLIDREEIYALEEWWKRIEALIARADTVVFVLSPDAVASTVALREVLFAASLNKRFAPVVCRRVDDKDVPEALSKLNFIFFDDDARFEASADRLAEALNTDIGWVRQHTDFGEQARRWGLANNPTGLLLRSPLLEQAERWIASRPRGAPEPTPETQAFVTRSRQAATRRRNVLTGSLAGGLVIALGLAGVAYWQRGVAVEQRGIAQQNEAQAKEERDRATRNFRLAHETAESLVFDIAQGLRNVRGMSAGTVRKILETAQATFEQLATSAPNDLALQRSRAAMLNVFGKTYATLGDLDQALKMQREGFAILERLAAGYPNNTQWQRDLTVSYIDIGDVLRDQGKLVEALKAFRDSLALRERLAATDLSKTLWQYDLGTSHDRIGDVLLAQGDLPAALIEYEAARNVISHLVVAEANNTEWQRTLTVDHNKVGTVLAAQGKIDEALTAYRDGLAVIERLVAADPSNTQWQRDLSLSFDRIGRMLGTQGKLDEALKTYRDGFAIVERLVAGDRSNTEWQRDLSVCYNNIGDVLNAQAKFDEALEAFSHGVAIRGQLVAADPSNTGWQRDLSVSYNKMGGVLTALGKLDEALKVYRDGLALVARLADIDPSNRQWSNDLQFSIGRIGGLAYNFVVARSFARALEAADQALSLAPTQLWLYTNRAHALMFLGRVDEARALYLRYRSETKVQDGKSWTTLVLEDFADLRKAGLIHPLMDEIEKTFASNG